MTLQASGVISLGNVNTELGLSATATIGMNDTSVRGLAGVASGAISMSNFHGKSNIPSGVLWAWGGDNAQGQMGLGFIAGNYSLPQQVGTATNWRSIGCGPMTNAGVRSDGTLWTWGYGGLGALGNGSSSVNYSSPVQVGTSTTWKMVTGNANSNFAAIKTDGTLWAWGQGAYGVLGSGSLSTLMLPSQIGTSTNWAMVSMGNIHTLAIKTDGTLWAWGTNNYGVLGTGGSTTYTPVQVGTATNWASVSAGGAHSMGIKTDGTLWVWGLNSTGQLGTGNYTDVPTPTQLGSSTWKSVSCGATATLAIKSDNTLWTCGQNNNTVYWQLGIGIVVVNQNTLTQIGSSAWSSIWMSDTSAMGIQTNGTLWHWGYYSISSGSNTNSTTPLQVGSSTTWKTLPTGRSNNGTQFAII